MIETASVTRILRRFASVALLLLTLSQAPNSKAQSCTPATTPTPTLNGQSWGNDNPKSVYIDPSLPSAVQSSIALAISAFQSETGQPITAMSISPPDPGIFAQNAIRMMNNPAGSPSNFAQTSTQVITMGGNATTQQIIRVPQVSPLRPGLPPHPIAITTRSDPPCAQHP